jgi:hypothetical protein
MVSYYGALFTTGQKNTAKQIKASAILPDVFLYNILTI